MPRVCPLLVAACAFAVAATSLCDDARADSGAGVGLGSPLSVDWAHELGAGVRWLAAQSEPKRELALRAEEVSLEAPRTGLRSALGVAPRVSLVARDWGAARSVAGGPLALTDAIRVSRSSRMAVARVRLSEGREGREGRVVPFVQAGLGQWRVDRDVLPHLPRNTELAAQLGAGLELHILPGFDVAAEADWTVLYRDVHEPQQLTPPRMWGGFLAARFELP